jgi:membrane protein DedA with SNARE-associated domain
MHVFSHIIHSFGLSGVFLLLFFENLGLPLPTEVGYVFAQALITDHHYSYLVVFSVLQASHCLGALSAYAVGRYFRDKRHNLPFTGQSASDAQDKLDIWFKKHGDATIFLSRLIGYVRPWSSYLAGVARTSFWPFLIYTFLGTAVFNVISLSFTTTFVHLWRHNPALRVIMVVLFLLSFSLIFFYKRLHKPKPSQ